MTFLENQQRFNKFSEDFSTIPEYLQLRMLEKEDDEDVLFVKSQDIRNLIANIIQDIVFAW